MSKTLLTTADVPKYIREIASRLRVTTNYKEGGTPGYVFLLYGKYKIGYEEMLDRDCEKLLVWCKRYYADAYKVSEHYWQTDVSPIPGGLRGDGSHRDKAYRIGYRNYIKLVITDPVAHRFEKDGFYREK